MTKAEAEALAATITDTPGFEVEYFSPRADGWAVQVRRFTPAGGISFPVRSRDEWEGHRALAPLPFPEKTESEETSC